MNYDDVEAAFRLMGLEPGAPLEEVKAAYKFSLQAFHPDKYPAESAAQKMATEKLIAVKDGYEILTAFFAEHPTGEPPEGWRTKQSQQQERPGQTKASSEDSTDWQSWEKGQETKAPDNDLHAWEQREVERQKEVKAGHGRDQRQKLVTYGKVALVIMCLALWSGKFSNNTYERVKRQQQANLLMEKAQYRQSTHDAASGYYKTDAQIHDEIDQEAERMKAQWMQEDMGRWFGVLMLIAMSGGTVWVFRSKKAKDFIDAWVDGTSK